MPCSWLPPLILLKDHDGDWTKFEEAVYAQCKRDLINSTPDFKIKRFVFDKKMSQGRELRYWHLVSEGPVEPDREPNIERCEKIAWIKPIVEEPHNPRVCAWKNTRPRKNGKGGIDRRIILSTTDFSYVVIFDDKDTYAYLLTAFPITNEYQQEKHRKQYEDWKKAGGAF